MCEWYTIVGFGSSLPMPARGPHRSYEDALSALGRFHDRHGYMAQTYLSASSVRVVGPYRTRREAQDADISDAPVAKDVS